MSTNGRAPGSGARYAVPAIGEVTAPGCLAGSTGAGAGIGRATGGVAAAGATAGSSTDVGTCTTGGRRATRTRMPFCSISISSRPVSSSRSASSWISSRSIATLLFCIARFESCMARSALGARADQGGKPDDGEAVALDPQAADHAARHARDVGLVAEAFARVDVADVHLDDRDLHREDRVENRHGCRGVAGGIDHDPDRLVPCRLLNPVDDRALVVRLAKLDRDVETLAGLAAQLLDVGERGAAVGLRLARAEQIEVRTI